MALPDLLVKERDRDVQDITQDGNGFRARAGRIALDWLIAASAPISPSADGASSRTRVGNSTLSQHTKTPPDPSLPDSCETG
jgi:hypothetical protein